MYTIIPINEFTYNLNIQGNSYDKNDKCKYHLCRSIQKLIKGSFLDHESISIHISAEKLTPFNTFISSQPNNRLSYHTCIQLVDDLTKQIMILHKFGYGIYGFDMDDILTIDNHFVFCGCRHVLPLENDHFIFTSPIRRPYFSSPELNKLTKLPAKLNYKCNYYSLGIFVSLCLLGSENINIDVLNDTKIYWFIKRCINEDVDKRVLLLI
jgi:hypothetical protein